MRSFLLLISLIGLWPGLVPDLLAQSSGSGCNCDFVIRQAGQYRNSSLGVKPGQTICVQAGHYEGLRFIGFVGTAEKPIRIINCGGQVTIGVEAYYTGVQLWDCQHLVFSGGGASQIQYGFKMTRSFNGASMLNITGRSSDIEVERIEIARAGFAGIMIKTDPGCDTTFWRSNFAMHNIKIHDNYIHHTNAEGMYLGSNYYTGANITCSGIRRVALPHLIYGLDVYNNITDSTGSEGIQFACAPDAKIHHNVIRNAGTKPFDASQTNGIQVGSGGGGDVYSNFITNSRGAALIVLGHLGGNRFFNNVMLNSGGDAVFIDERPGSVPNTTVVFANNTIHNAKRDGIRLYNETNTNVIVNNSITRFNASGDPNWWSAGVAIKPWLGAKATLLNNFTSLQATAAGYVNPGGLDFRPASGSPLINTGADALAWGVAEDLNRIARPEGGRYDIGAYEFVSPVPTPARLAAEPSLASGTILPEGTGKPGRELLPEAGGWGPSSDYLSHREDQTALLAPKPGLPGLNAEEEAVQSFAYPSPCREQVTIRLPAQLQTERVVIYNAKGDTQTELIPAAMASSVTVPTASWIPGLYTYRLLTPDGKKHQGRFVKQ